MTERRASKRITANVETKFFISNMFYAGNVKDFSKEGMLIKTNIIVPFGSLFVVTLSVKDKLLKLLVRVRRIVEKNSIFPGVGVEVINPPQQYADFVEDLSTYLYP